MGYPSQDTDLLRILVADDDDVHAFTMQCAINRLSKPCALLRVDNRELLARKIQSFEPEILVLSGSLAEPDGLRQINQLMQGRPVICLVATGEAGEASLAAGASDCILISQADELGTCLERHLDGGAHPPHFRTAISPSSESRLSHAEARLEELDRKIGAALRRFARNTRMKWNHFSRATTVGVTALRRSATGKYREFKVKNLLRKQERLVKKPIILGDRPAANLPLPIQPQFSSPPVEIPLSRPPFPNPDESDALRSLEISFKTLFHTTLDPMFLLDGHGTILHSNPAAGALLEMTPPEILGKTFFDFLSENERKSGSTMWESLLIEGQVKRDLVLETPAGGKEVFIAARANLWFGVHLLIARDQSELKKLRRELATSRTVVQRDGTHQTSTGPLGTGMASRCADAGSMNEENNGAGR